MIYYLIEVHWADGTVEPFFRQKMVESFDEYIDWREVAMKMAHNKYNNPVVEVKRLKVELWPTNKTDPNSRPEDRITPQELLLRCLNRDNFAMTTTLSDHWIKEGWNDNVNRRI